MVGSRIGTPDRAWTSEGRHIFHILGVKGNRVRARCPADAELAVTCRQVPKAKHESPRVRVRGEAGVCKSLEIQAPGLSEPSC